MYSCYKLNFTLSRMVVSFAYYGLSLNTSNLNGDLYLNFAISGLVEAPGYLIVLFLIDRIGRRWLYFWLMLLGGIACVSTIFTVEYGSEGTSSFKLSYNFYIV